MIFIVVWCAPRTCGRQQDWKGKCPVPDRLSVFYFVEMLCCCNTGTQVHQITFAHQKSKQDEMFFFVQQAAELRREWMFVHSEDLRDAERFEG